MLDLDEETLALLTPGREDSFETAWKLRRHHQGQQLGFNKKQAQPPIQTLEWQKLYQREYRKKNKGGIAAGRKAAQSRYYQKHKAKRVAYIKEWKRGQNERRKEREAEEAKSNGVDQYRELSKKAL